MTIEQGPGLDELIASWREWMSRREVLTASDVDELESHLRDRIDGLADAGLTEDEAFLIAVKRLGGIKGDSLTNAVQTTEQQTGLPVVSITFDQQGGAKFAKLTTENVGRPFAIILDGKVISAPNINEPILGGSAQISGSFTIASANELAIQLRSGALPVDLKVIEERSVGPDLGADSIRKGVIAMIVGTVALMTFMVVTYGRFGVFRAAGALVCAGAFRATAARTSSLKALSLIWSPSRKSMARRTLPSRLELNSFSGSRSAEEERRASCYANARTSWSFSPRSATRASSRMCAT